MTDGMIIRRDSGATVLDNTFKTLGLSDVIDVGISASTTSVTYTLNVSGENVMVACYSAALEHSVYSISDSGSSAIIVFLFRGPGGPTSETVRFFVFSNPVFGSEDFGIKIFDGSGSPVFSNFKKPIRIAGVVPGNSGFTGTSGRLYAPIILSRHDDVTFNNGVIWNVRYSFLQCAGNVINANMRVVKTVSGIRRSPTGATYLAADVTDY